MTALVGTETIVTQTASGSTITSAGSTALAVALLAGANPGRVNTAVTTGIGTTLSYPGIIGGVITRTGPTANYTDTFDTATNIIMNLPTDTPASTSWLLFIRNGVHYTQTLAAGVGISLSGEVTVPGNSVWVGQVTYTVSSTVTILGVGTFFDGGSGYLSSALSTQFGSGTATFFGEGNISRLVSATGVSPGGTAADNVIATYTLPANSFDGIGNRGLRINAAGTFGANGNNKRIKVMFNPASATLGSTVGASGTTCVDTGTLTTSGGGWVVTGAVFKYGAAVSNTQICMNLGSMAGTSHLGTAAPALATASETGGIFIAVTGNASTSTSDIMLNWFEVNVVN